MDQPAPSRPFTVTEYQQMFASIYTKANERYSDDKLLLRLIEEACIVVELARKDEREKMPEQLARIYSWLNALANRLGASLQKALWWKYPNVCTYCMRLADCICAIEHPHHIQDKEAILRRLRRDRSKEPKLLREHQELHMRLYGRQNRRIMLVQIAAHLAEEAGEISHEFRHKDRERLESEMVDAVSWIFAIANYLKIDMAEQIWNQYPYECEKCHQMECVDDCSDPPKSQAATLLAQSLMETPS